MAEENTTPDGQDAGQQSGDTDYKAMYDQLQAQHSQQGQELARLSGELDALRPYVQFGPQQSQPQEPAYDPDDPDQVTDYKINQAVSQVKGTYDSKLASMEFLMDNPDLKEHADLVAVQLNKTDSHKPIKSRLNEAAKAVRDKLKKQEEIAIAKYQKQLEAEQKKKANADGVMTGHDAPSHTSAEEAMTESNEDYAASRAKFASEVANA